MQRIIDRIYQDQLKRQSTLNQIRNGRVDIEGKPLVQTGTADMFGYYRQHSLFEESTYGQNKYRYEAVGSIYERNPVQDMFFSDANIVLLQKLLAYHVAIQTNNQIKIGTQDDTELKIVMKSVYLQYGKNKKGNVKDQVKELNAHVLDYSIPNIITNARQYVKYANDVSTLPVPLENPKYTSSAGTRTHPDYIF
jgi:hypothetical protein